MLCVCLVAQSCLTLCNPMDCSPPGSSVHGDSPVKNTGVGCHALLQGIFPTQGSNPGLMHCRRILYHLSHQGHPVNIKPQGSGFWERMHVSLEKTTSWISEGKLAKEGFPKRSSMISFQSNLSPNYSWSHKNLCQPWYYLFCQLPWAIKSFSCLHY